MNVRCLIGHDYGDLQTSRDREERGDEVVVTAVEYRECSRCGDRRIVSENKEVTSIEAGPSEADGDGESAEADARGAGTDAGRSERIDTGTGSDAGEYDNVTAEEDDGVILDDDPDSEGRERGEWPDVEGEDEGYSAAAGDDSGDDPVDGVEFGGGIAPGSRPDPPAGAEGEEGWTGDAVEASGSGDAAPSPAVGADTEFACPECGHTAPSRGSSLRPGDICPECREGYLAEREAPAGE